MVSGGKKQKEQNRGELWGERSQLRQIKGRQGRQEGWARSLRVHPGNSVCQCRDKSREDWRYQLSNPRYTSDDVLNQSNTGVSLSCPGPGS